MLVGPALRPLTTLLTHFRSVFILLVVGSLLATTAAFMTLTRWEVTRSTLEQGDAEARNILRVIMLNLEDHAVGLEFFRSYARTRYEQELRDLVSVVISEVDSYHALAERGVLTEAQAMRAALDAVERNRYGSNDYFSIYDRHSVAISHADPRIRGRDMSDATDEEGRVVSTAIREMVKERQEGFVTVSSMRLGEEKPVPKLVYFRHYPKWDWMIGTGVYVDDIDRDIEAKKGEILAVLQQVFRSVRVAETGYFFLFDGDGRMLSHPALAGTGATAIGDAAASPKLQALMAASGTPDVPVRYLWDKPTAPGRYEYRKRAHVQHFAPFNWYVSSSVYEDEMELPAERILERQAILVGAIVLLASLGVALLVSRMTRSLSRLDRHAALLEASNFSASESERNDLATIRFPSEVGHLARTFRDMESRLADYLQHLRETTAARERMASELRIAHDIQMSMLPDRRRILRERTEIDLAAVLEPAREVGGDLYDFFMTGPNRLCFLIGDVSDKGVPAALFMARGKAILRSAASSPHAAPDGILAEANRDLSEGNEPMMYITVSLGILDLSTGDLAISNAGHLPPLLCSSSGQCGWLEPPPGMPLGVRSTARFECRHLRLLPGDSLVVITDGVTEAQNELLSFFGEERVVACLGEMVAPERADAIIERLFREVRAFRGGAPQSDDIAVVCIRYLGRPGPTVSPAASPGEKPPIDRPAVGSGGVSASGVGSRDPTFAPPSGMFAPPSAGAVTLL